MFTGTCIFMYEDHISNQRDATFYVHLLIATLYTCFGRTRPSSGAQELCVQPMVLSC
jgi:hypothetical protein